MRRISTRGFRDSFGTLEEPVEVLRGVETIGFFYPGRFPPQMARGIVADDGYAPLGPLVTPEEHRSIPGKVSSEMPTMKPGSAPRSTTLPAQQRFSSKPFTPVPKGK